VNQSLSVDVFDPETDLVKDRLGLDGPDCRVEAAVHFQPMPETLLLAELHHDVEVRPRPI
jgi:hypothetical protein